jgi:hypothetical protein
VSLWHGITIFSHAQVCSDNGAKLKILEERKQGLLFSSTNLIDILDLIPSKKTQISIIESLGPRLLDPKCRANDITDRFRYAEEKRVVQDVLKTRAHTLSCSQMYSAPKASAQPGVSKHNSNPIAMSGRGGRGRGMARAVTRADVSRSEPVPYIRAGERYPWLVVF